MTGEFRRCGAKLFLGDDFGDNTTTMTCQLPSGHEGQHAESFKRSNCNDTAAEPGEVSVVWTHDERYRCPKHGLVDEPYCSTCMAEEVDDEP